VQKKENAIDVAYALAGGIKYNVGRRLYLTAAAEYFATGEATFKNVESKLTIIRGQPGDPNYQVSETRTRQDGQQKVAAINITAGIGIDL
jgi:hypothetical protein